jgi:hypothetical protein
MKLTVVGSGGCSSASNKLPVGAYSIRAIYQGGSDFKTSSSASAPLTVT